MLRGTPSSNKSEEAPARRKPIPSSSLPLFVAGIRAHDKDDAAATDNLARVADATDAGANLHTCDRGDGRPRLQREQGN